MTLKIMSLPRQNELNQNKILLNYFKHFVLKIYLRVAKLLKKTNKMRKLAVCKHHLKLSIPLGKLLALIYVALLSQIKAL